VTSAWRSQIFELLTSRSAAEIKVPYTGAERILLVHVEDVARALVTLALARSLRHTVYNVPCESLRVEDLKRKIESLNSNVIVGVGEGGAVGNPRRIDSSRFGGEFGFQIASMFEQMERAASGDDRRTTGGTPALHS
jgi:nucleoside-diphosphate-sugar epimerase